MGNYENLKQSITEVIRTNGNQEITGAVLQNTLLTIVSTVGANATFAGIATPETNPGTPDGPVFYLASEGGTYSNFGGITLTDEVAILLSNTNGSWVKSGTGIATSTKVSELGNEIKEVNNKKLERYNNNDVTTIADKSETFFITDSLGNIIAKTAKDGISTTNLNTPRINGKSFSFDNIKSFYYGKNIVLFGDSLSCSGQWALKFAELTGAIFDQSINDGTSEINNGYPTSYGGTQSWGFGNGGWQRAMNIVEKVSNTNNVNGIDINVLFIMNVNDAYKVTTGIKKGDEGYGVDSSGYTLSEDGAYVPDFSLFLETPAFFSRTRVIAETVFDTEEEALNDFRNNIIQRWGNVDRSAFCCYTYRHYSSQAKLLTINGNTTSAGTLTIHIGEQAYGIEITQGMTANAVIKAIENYDYNGCNDVIQPDGISILFSKKDNTTIDLTVDVGTTGIGYTITNRNSIREVELFYSLYDTSDGNFTDSSNWKYIYQITNIFGLYKGVIEYFQKNLSNTKIVFLSGPVINLPFGDSEKIKEYQNADGSLSLQKIIEKESYMKTHPALRQIQQYVCQKYMIDYVDLANRNGISFFNAYPKYYNNADVHPRNEGYEHWGEWLAYNL